MEPVHEKPWRRNAPNELIVNSILAATSAIVVQTIVTAEHPKYGVGWLVAGLAALIFFLISAEQLGESMREDHINLWITSIICYNIGVFLLILSLWAIFVRDAESLFWTIVSAMALALVWAWFWGLDTAFLIRGNEYYWRWKRKMDGEVVDEEILDYRDMLVTRVRSWMHWK